MGFRVAVVGATGNVGREFLTILAERDFPADDVVALASNRSVGREVSFGEDDILKVQALDTFNFRGIDIVLSSPGSKVSAAFAPRATKAGAIVIDNTSCFRMEPDVPLVVPEVNPDAVRNRPKGIIANGDILDGGTISNGYQIWPRRFDNGVEANPDILPNFYSPPAIEPDAPARCARHMTSQHLLKPVL
jgi:hypothetical protein